MNPMAWSAQFLRRNLTFDLAYRLKFLTSELFSTGENEYNCVFPILLDLNMNDLEECLWTFQCMMFHISLEYRWYYGNYKCSPVVYEKNVYQIWRNQCEIIL